LFIGIYSVLLVREIVIWLSFDYIDGFVLSCCVGGLVNVIQEVDPMIEGI
jgi:hypothetical protein